MADFKTALKALGEGRIGREALGKQLDKLLDQAPQHALRLLQALDEALSQETIGDQDYAELKRQINQYRRKHASQTEGGDAGDEATVFAEEDNPEAGADLDSEESTEVRDKERSSEDPTLARESAGDGTQVLTDEEKAGAGGGVDLDVSAPSLDSGGGSVPPSTGPTGTQWQTPMSSEAAIAEEMGPGSVIKERFKLLDVLGVGGMGKVYKGIDLLKQEARDKNPYVAIKLLNEDFKSHPEAFIALQRESSRQQKLAHPNIATVYDFDRIGGPGTPVYITMELMEGQPLNTYIKKTVRKQGGLPFAEAFPIVTQLGAALQYAHERRLVHSDFKPGNAFLCNDGTVKTLDFGIARAVKNPITGEGEKTLFDPGKLGALTPAYASLEMLEGEEPDPRDDIYALGCVTYELLTGKHPFNKLPANTARDNGLVPAPVKGLNKKQNRALRRAVAFKREDRVDKVEDFLEEFEGKANLHKNPFFIAAMVLLIVGAIAVQPAREYLHQQEIQQIITEIQSGGKQAIVAKLDQIRGMERSDQNAITDEAKDAIQRYFTNEITANIDITGESYDFPEAQRVLGEVEYFYPESLFFQTMQNEIELNRKQKLAELYNNYIAALKPDEGEQLDPTAIDNTRSILDTIRRRIDAQHPLLTDPRPANAYRLVAQSAFEEGDYQQALAYIDSGMQTAPDDPRLADLQTKVQRAIRVAELRDSLSAVELAALADYKQYEDQIVELSNLGTTQEAPVLDTLSAGLRARVEEELAGILSSGTRADAETMAAEYSSLMSALQLDEQLTQVKLAHLSGEERSAAIREIASADKAVIEQSLASPQMDNLQWESELLSRVRELNSLQAEDADIAPDLEQYRQTIAQLYVDRAGEVLKANRFDAAEGFINRGERFAPDLAMIQDTRSTIAQAKAEFERQQRINDLKEQFKYQTDANQVAEAQQTFDTLKAELPEDDSYISRTAPSMLADSYRQVAQRRAEGGDFTSALAAADAGLKLVPRDALLRGLRDEYRVEVNITELANMFRDVTVLTQDQVLDVARRVNQIEADAPTRYPEFRRQSETVLAERINQLAQTDENQAAALADAASSIFRTSSVLADLTEQFQLEPWPNRGVADAALEAGELTRASQILQQAAAGEYAGHPEVQDFRASLETSVKEANQAFSVYETARDAAGDKFDALRQAKRLLARAQAIWVDNPDYTAAEDNIDQLIANAPDNPAKRVIRREEVDIAAAADTTTQKEPWEPVSSGRECTANLAGYGTRARAICYDFVNTGWRGPLMVVVPPGGDFDRGFAIGKYELSVGDWSKYCAVTGKCKPETDQDKFDDPVTGVTLQQAQEYVQWLSERTGKTYRLPTDEEWRYAASAGGALSAESAEFRQLKGTLNCRVTMGDKVLKGTGTASVKTGASNDWGLKNFIGNVQEWVIDGAGAASARGGAFSDAINNCDLSTVRPHNGNADEATGFRIVLEEVG